MEDSQRTNAHHGYSTFVLETFNRSLSNVAAIIGDTCNVNRSLANKMNVGFIGCSSHRYNLAIKDSMADDDSSVYIEKVRKLTKYLRRPVIAGHLLEKNPFESCKRLCDKMEFNSQDVTKICRICRQKRI